MTENKQTTPISYHTFLLPFIWNKWNDKDRYYELSGEDYTSEQKQVKLRKRLSADHWKEITWKNGEMPDKYSFESDKAHDARQKQQYDAYQYFDRPARELILGKMSKAAESGNGEYVMRSYEFHPDGKPLGEHCRYVIKKKNEVDYCYSLLIKRIRINLYNTGISVMILEMENHDYKQPDDVNRINEYGRRIALPYKPSHEPTCKVTADSICIEGIGSDSMCNSYLIENPGLTHIMDPIKKLIGYGSLMQPTSKREHCELEGKYLITPVMDDRMFVCCFYRNEEMMNAIQEKIPVGTATYDDYAYLAGCNANAEAKNVTDNLYKFAFVEDNLTCQSGTMKRSILERCIYDRWIDCGTVYAVTHHSFMALSSVGENELDTVIIPFNNIYLEFTVMVLAQRASLISLTARAAALAGEKDKNEKVGGFAKKVVGIQEENAKAQNQIILSEVTVQEQGVELYEMMRHELFIERANRDFKDQMQNLYEITMAQQAQTEERKEKSLSIYLAILTAITVPFAVLDGLGLAIDSFSWNSARIITCVIAVLACIVLLCLIRKRKI
jgi:hypothetical protein